MSQPTKGVQGRLGISTARPAIGIITALPKEYRAMRSVLEQPHNYNAPGQAAGHRYVVGEIPAVQGGNHSVVLALCADTGTNLAAARVMQLLMHFPSVNKVIMVGIAGGVPNPGKVDEHVRLGDVVISDRNGVVNYEFKTESDTEIIPRFPPRPPSAMLLEAVLLLETEDDKPWLRFIHTACTACRVTRPPEDTDILASTDHPTVVISHPPDFKRHEGEPRIFTGPIASADTLLKNAQHRDELQRQFRVKAVEMEGSGIADAAWSREVGYLVIRGICDYCDSYKNDTWQAYAAISAAAYTRALLESLPVADTNVTDTNSAAILSSSALIEDGALKLSTYVIETRHTVEEVHRSFGGITFVSPIQCDKSITSLRMLAGNIGWICNWLDNAFPLSPSDHHLRALLVVLRPKIEKQVQELVELIKAFRDICLEPTERMTRRRAVIHGKLGSLIESFNEIQAGIKNPVE